jgi:hypothetical protein
MVYAVDAAIHTNILVCNKCTISLTRFILLPSKNYFLISILQNMLGTGIKSILASTYFLNL